MQIFKYRLLGKSITEYSKETISLENGVPIFDTMLRVLAIMDSKCFEEPLISIKKTYIRIKTKEIKEFISFDGNAIRYSRRKFGRFYDE